MGYGSFLEGSYQDREGKVKMLVSQVTRQPPRENDWTCDTHLLCYKISHCTTGNHVVAREFATYSLFGGFANMARHPNTS